MAVLGVLRRRPIPNFLLSLSRSLTAESLCPHCSSIPVARNSCTPHTEPQTAATAAARTPSSTPASTSHSHLSQPLTHLSEPLPWLRLHHFLAPSHLKEGTEASSRFSFSRACASLVGASASLEGASASLAGASASLAGANASLEGREEMEYDVVIVGAGPAGLASAIRLKQLDPDLSVCVLEKGAQAGSHILSGNVFEPRALDELLPDWRAAGAPLCVPVTSDRFRLLASPSLSLPVPSPSSNEGNFIISLSELVRWLAAQAEELGVEVYPGIAGAQLLLSDTRSGALYLSGDRQNAGARGGEGGTLGGSGAPEACRVVGVVTGDVGIDKGGAPKDSFQPGMVLRGRATLLAEGCRGSLSQDAIRRYGLVSQAGAQHQTYALGIKEVWQVGEAQHRLGEVLHTLGYPLDSGTYGGGFVYHMDENLVALGLVVALDYRNPHLSIFQEFQKWKQHPEIRRVLEGGSVVQYGARALNEGGFQSVPSLVFPGGALVGCAAGFLNVPKIKGSHTAIKSGMLAAEALMSAFKRPSAPASTPASPSGVLEASAPAATAGAASDPTVPGEGSTGTAGAAVGGEGDGDFGTSSGEGLSVPSYRDVDEALGRYPEALKRSWAWEELRRVRNVRPGFKWGLLPGLLNAAFEIFISRGNSPWTLSHGEADNASLAKLSDWKQPPPQYPKPDGVITFDILTSVYRSSTNHNHDEPPHLKLLDPTVPSRLNLPIYGGPEAKYCPAKVYEYVRDESGKEALQINAQNCLHCKACDIKDPSQNIRWAPPEGGGGPGYTVM